MANYFIDNIQPADRDFQPVSAVRVINDEDYIVDHDDLYIIYSNLTASRTVTLPEAAYNVGHRVVITDGAGKAGTYNIQIVPGFGELINGASSDNITMDYGSASYVSDGTNWVKVANVTSGVNIAPLTDFMQTGWYQHTETLTPGYTQTLTYNSDYYLSFIEIPNSFLTYAYEGRWLKIKWGSTYVYGLILGSVTGTPNYAVVFTGTTAVNTSASITEVYTSGELRPTGLELFTDIRKNITDSSVSGTTFAEANNGVFIVPRGKWLVEADIEYRISLATPPAYVDTIGAQFAISTASNAISNTRAAQKIERVLPAVNSNTHNEFSGHTRISIIVENTSETTYRVIFAGINTDSAVTLTGDRSTIRVRKIMY